MTNITLIGSQKRLELYATHGEPYALQKLDTINVLAALIVQTQLLADCKKQLDEARGVVS